MLKSEFLSTHDRILHKTLQNCSKRNIHARVTNIQTSLQQIRERSNCKKICVECYSMLKYIILSQIEKKIYPSVDYLLQNQKELKPIIDLVNCIIYGITQMYGDSEDFILIFPQEDHFRVNKHYEGPLKILMNQLLTAQFKQERKKQQCSFEGEESAIYELAKILFLKIGANVRNPFTFEEKISFFGQMSEEFQSPKVLIKIIVPWLNNSLFYEDPCAVQLSYLASQGFICFSWSTCCLNYIPIGIYIIGFKVENLVALTKQSTKLRKLRDDGIQHSIERKLEYQDRILKDLQKKIKESENILYIFDTFMERIEKYCFPGTFFRTDQLFLTSLLPFSNELDLSERNLTEIRSGRYSMAEWMAKKVFIQYLMIELHPIIAQVSQYKYEVRCSKAYANKFKVLFEQDIAYASLQQQHKVIKNYSQKYLFIHRSFQGYINQYIPNNLQQIHRFFNSSPIKDLQDQQTKKRKNNSTSETEGNKQIEQQTKRKVTRNLFNNNLKGNYSQVRNMDEKNLNMIENGFINETVETDSDIDQQYKDM